MMTKEGSTKTVKFTTPKVINIEDVIIPQKSFSYILLKKICGWERARGGTEYTCKYNFDDLYQQKHIDCYCINCGL